MLMGPRQSALLRQNPCISTIISQVVKKLTANIVHLNHEPEKKSFSTLDPECDTDFSSLVC